MVFHSPVGGYARVLRLLLATLVSKRCRFVVIDSFRPSLGNLPFADVR